MTKKDNANFRSKILFRERLLSLITPTGIVETNGGTGRIYNCLYREFSGSVFEKDYWKALALAEQRPEWAVYQCDCVAAASRGVGFGPSVNYVDIDPYGSPWAVVDAVLSNARKMAPRFGVAVNDGLRASLSYGGGWQIEEMKPYVRQYGTTGLWPRYGDIVSDRFGRVAAANGVRVTAMELAFGGYNDQMTNFYAVCEADAGAPADSKGAAHVQG